MAAVYRRDGMVAQRFPRKNPISLGLKFHRTLDSLIPDRALFTSQRDEYDRSRALIESTRNHSRGSCFLLAGNRGSFIPTTPSELLLEGQNIRVVI